MRPRVTSGRPSERSNLPTRGDDVHDIDELARKNPKLVVGLISGPSADGIDAALVEVSGAGLTARLRLLAGLTLPIAAPDRDELFQIFDPPVPTGGRLRRFNL